jgi:hypothetical protein
MGDLAFGTTIRMLGDDENRFIMDVMDKSAGVSLLVSCQPLIYNP